MKNSCLSFFIITVSLFYSCTPVRVISSEEKEGVDFASYKTFNFLDVSLKNDSLTEESIPEIQLIKNAIAFQMKDLGYSLSKNPDLWVNVGLMVEEKVQTRETNINEAPIYIGQRRYHWESEEVIVDEYEEGMVTIDIIDAEAMERIWEGIAVGTITENEQKMEKRINDAMELLFNRYPNSADM